MKAIIAIFIALVMFATSSAIASSLCCKLSKADTEHTMQKDADCHKQSVSKKSDNGCKNCFCVHSVPFSANTNQVKQITQLENKNIVLEPINNYSSRVNTLLRPPKKLS